MVENKRVVSDKAKVCKTFIRRFDSDPRLQQNNRLTIGNH